MKQMRPSKRVRQNVVPCLVGVVLLFSLALANGTSSILITAQSQMGEIKFSLALFRVFNPDLPATTQGLKVLVNPPEGSRSSRPFIDAEDIIDPWGNPYRYRCPSLRPERPYDLWSMGPDELDGTKDDIQSLD